MANPRVFEISDELQERYGYPAVTPELRATVFGLNATRPLRASRDELHQKRDIYRNAPDPKFATYGPKTRREFLTLKWWERA